jgi:DnaJ family protein B protein 4
MERMDLREAYRVLEVPVGASEAAVREARKTLAKVWHPDRHANDPELAKKAQQKLADINTAFEAIRAASFPSSVAEPKAAPATPPRPAPPPAAPPPVAANIEFVPRRRLRLWVLFLPLVAAGVGSYLAIRELARNTPGRGVIEYRADAAVAVLTPPPPQPPPAAADAAAAPPATSTFDLGATEAEVRAIQGEPDVALGALHQWNYKVANVTFDHGVVVAFWNPDHSLRVEMHPKDAAAAARARAAGTYTVGASRDEVIALDGTPEIIERVIDETWHYEGGSSIEFDKQGRVKKIDDFGQNLHGH